MAIINKINSFQLSQHVWGQDTFKFSPDGKFIISYGDVYHSEMIIIWDVFSGRQSRKLNKNVIYASFLPSGNEIINIYKSGEIYIWNLLEDTEIKIFELDLDLSSSIDFHIPDFYLTPDGHFLYCFLFRLGYLSSFQVVDISNMKNSGKLIISPFDVVCYASILGDSLFFCLNGKKTRVTLKKINNTDIECLLKTTLIWTDEPLEILSSILCINHNDQITLYENVQENSFERRESRVGTFRASDYSVSENGRYIASINYKRDYDGNPYDGDYSIWDLDSKSKVRTFKHPSDKIGPFKLSKFGRYFSDGSAIWNVITGELCVEIEEQEEICTEFSPDERYAIIKRDFTAGTTLLIDLENNGKVIKAIGGYGGYGCFHTQASFGLANNCVITTDGGRGPDLSEGYTIVWDLTTGLARNTLISSPGCFAGIKSISQNSKWALTRSHKKSHRNGVWETIINVWDINSGEIISECNDLKESIVFIPDQEHMLTASSIWDLKTFKTVRKYSNHDDYNGSICISNNGYLSLSECKDGSMALWNILTGDEINRFKNDALDYDAPIMFSPDDKLALSFGGYKSKRSIAIWNLKTKKLLRIIVPDRNNYKCATFLPDSKLIISGGYEVPRVSIWDYESRTLMFMKDMPDEVTSIYLSPDEKLLFLATRKEISTWELGELKIDAKSSSDEAKNQLGEYFDEDVEKDFGDIDDVLVKTKIVTSIVMKKDLIKEKSFDENLKVKRLSGAFSTFKDLEGKTVCRWWGKGIKIGGLLVISRENWVSFATYCNERDLNVEILQWEKDMWVSDRG